MGIKSRLSVCATVSAVLMLTVSLAQNTQSSGRETPGLHFDAVSVKVAPTRPELGYRFTPGRFSASAMRLSDLISLAYGMPKERLVLPDWTKTPYFAIEAQMPPKASQEQFKEMLRAMLEERFSLRVKRESRETPVLLLIKARPDGGLGSQLRAVQKDCAKPETHCFEQQGRGVLEESGRSWEQIRLASFVSLVLGEVVLDRTGLAGGQYDMRLRWQFDLAADGNSDAERPSTLHGALEEQLGLRLERARERVELLVADNVAMPSED